MNARVIWHVVAAVAAAISGGTVAFQGLPDVVSANIVAIAALVVIGINVGLGMTSTGVTTRIQARLSRKIPKR